MVKIDEKGICLHRQREVIEQVQDPKYKLVLL